MKYIFKKKKTIFLNQKKTLLRIRNLSVSYSINIEEDLISDDDSENIQIESTVSMEEEEEEKKNKLKLSEKWKFNTTLPRKSERWKIQLSKDAVRFY